jgi:hypothetical protein
VGQESDRYPEPTLDDQAPQTEGVVEPAGIVQEAGAPGPESPFPETPLPQLSQEETPDSILLSELPIHDLEQEVGPSFWLAALYSFVGVVLLVALALQLLYFLRAQVVEWLPETRPYFEQACETLGCTVPLSHQIDRLKVESSSLETDPEQSAHAKLKVSFSNRSRQVQAWPSFALGLTDVRGGTLARRIFQPKDYLPKDKAEKGGMAPMSELEFKFDLDMTGLNAAGYEIKPLYP